MGWKMSYGLARGNTDLLFCSVDMHSAIEQSRMKCLEMVDTIDGDRLLNSSTDELANYFAEEHAFNVPVLLEDEIVADQQEVDIDVSQEQMRFIHDRSSPYYITGTKVTIEIPFEGDGGFFQVQPNPFSLSPPRGVVSQGRVIITMSGTDLGAEKVKQEVERIIADIKVCLENHRKSAVQFNGSLLPLLVQKIDQRKEKLLKDRNLVADLGFALKSRDGAAKTYASPSVKRKIAPKKIPLASNKPYEPEPVMLDADYENILSIMENMVEVMECSPKAFEGMDEEALRSHFLVQLNGQHEMNATGETFNYEGKTDILVNCEGKNIFIAECKFWKGGKQYLATIDQLLGYLSWRDTKASIVIFNRNKNFSKVLDEIENITSEHDNFKRLVKKRSETSWEYKFEHKNDADREMTITVLAFDVPSCEAEPSLTAL